MPAYATAKPVPNPVQKAARTANGWGWSYIITILGAFGAGYVQPGPLRVLLLNFGVLCCVIGVLELVWRHKLLQTCEPRWARTLALNQVFGTLALMWSFYLLYQVPEQILVDYSHQSDLWNRVFPLLKSMDSTHLLNDSYILHMWHVTKLFVVYVLGAVTLLSQIWVVGRYLRLACEIENTPPGLRQLPPVLK